jgi:hypothetical protein
MKECLIRKMKFFCYWFMKQEDGKKDGVGES